MAEIQFLLEAESEWSDSVALPVIPSIMTYLTVPSVIIDLDSR